MRWNLRLAAAHRGIWKASELQAKLAEHGLVISAGKMSGLWSGHPVGFQKSARLWCAAVSRGPFVLVDQATQNWSTLDAFMVE
ncbi:MAG: helix-turn-helix domain-containing protein, partial [Actinomycetota bacterium]|nr:helix-turn-helix domain-containing protein [Actinomycetota bacterium]